jgi:hypothetical protein
VRNAQWLYVFRDQFKRVLPASSVANFYPFNYSGKTDGNGFYVGIDKFGSNYCITVFAMFT